MNRMDFLQNLRKFSTYFDYNLVNKVVLLANGINYFFEKKKNYHILVKHYISKLSYITSIY